MATSGEHAFEKEIDKSVNSEQEMADKPVYERDYDRQLKKLQDKVAIITGGDSGIGKAVAVHFAREGADVVIVYRAEKEDAEETKSLIEEKGRRALLIQTDVSSETNCQDIVKQTLAEFGKIDIVVNNAAVQVPKEDFSEITAEQWEETFKVNIHAQFYLSKAALQHLKPGASIINTASVNAYKGHKLLVDYTSTKGAIIAFTRSIALQLAEKGIRVNAVAPGPIWTPLIPSTMHKGLDEFGQEVPMKRAGQPAEVAPSYVFLASEDSSYFTGQCLHPNGGYILNT
ncbi:SDR family oxidoreductase [Segetibacter sp.]|jgi:NAD(P)-dependent dehydrogenase (short-subunit alcohol dehydrogenase family)|uniref:SDR family oxidoreductase n=1 Tax=Segetibacter sp. TaxID=2231182 RepID=UPI00260E1A14|nr:SDR family oxidoreductase [Segetibacter sp.]MCW3078917.1 family NAD(P)-dependent oxidoreductase [Segetibacter sp.]